MVVKRRRKISKTPRSHAHSRKVEFSIGMREKISEDWVALRKELRKKKKKKKRRKK